MYHPYIHCPAAAIVSEGFVLGDGRVAMTITTEVAEAVEKHIKSMQDGQLHHGCKELINVLKKAPPEVLNMRFERFECSFCHLHVCRLIFWRFPKGLRSPSVSCIPFRMAGL